MTDVACPGCGTVREVEQFHRDASEFCSVCDYPLFWVRTTVLGTGTTDDEGNGLRRLPGTAGRVAPASLACPVCTEPNLVTAVVCIRCGADMHPVEPVPEPVIEPEPEPEPEPVYVPPPRVIWPWILLAVLLVLTLIAVIWVVVT
jgi:hypothetical protein